MDQWGGGGGGGGGGAGKGKDPWLPCFSVSLAIFMIPTLVAEFKVYLKFQ